MGRPAVRGQDSRPLDGALAHGPTACVVPLRSLVSGRATAPLDLTDPCRPVLPQDLQSGVLIAPSDDVNGLVLERLVGIEELLDLDQAMRADLLQSLDVLLVGIAERDAQHLEV